MNLVKSDLETFAQEKSKLAASRAEIATAKKEAKYQANARVYFESLTSEGQSLDASLAELPRVESDADKFIAHTKRRRDNLVDQIRALRAKLQFSSSNDVGEIESIIRGLFGELNGLASEFNASSHFAAVDYDKLHSSLENFKSRCDQWTAKYSSSSPPQCKNFQTYAGSYQSSRINMRHKYQEAGEMFVFQ